MLISLGERVTVRNAADICAALLVAICDHSEIELDASAVSEADLSFLQLIEAARIHAAQQQKSVRMTTCANAAVVALLDRSGFLTRMRAADFDFWCEGADRQ